MIVAALRHHVSAAEFPDLFQEFPRLPPFFTLFMSFAHECSRWIHGNHWPDETICDGFPAHSQTTQIRALSLSPNATAKKPRIAAWVCGSAQRVNWFTRTLKTIRHDERMGTRALIGATTSGEIK